MGFPQTERLSDNCLRLVAGALDAVSFLRLRATCRRFHATTLDEYTFHITINPKRHPHGILPWLQRRPLDVHGLNCVRLYYYSQFPSSFEHFSNLRALHIRLCRIPWTLLAGIPPSLEVLEVHQVIPSCMPPVPDFLASLTKLRSLSVTFARCTRIVNIHHLAPTVTHMSFRKAQVIHVHAVPPNLQFLELDALFIIRCLSEAATLPVSIKHVALSCKSSTVDMKRFFRHKEYPCMQSLRIRSLHTTRLQWLAKFPALRIFEVWLNSAVLQNSVKIPRTLEVFSLHVKWCFAFGESVEALCMAISRIPRVLITAGGVKRDIAQVLGMA